jgi:hypothetical protein
MLNPITALPVLKISASWLHNNGRQIICKIISPWSYVYFPQMASWWRNFHMHEFWRHDYGYCQLKIFLFHTPLHIILHGQLEFQVIIINIALHDARKPVMLWFPCPSMNNNGRNNQKHNKPWLLYFPKIIVDRHISEMMLNST